MMAITLFVQWSYRGRTVVAPDVSRASRLAAMGSVVKRSVSLPEELFAELERRAAAEGRSVSSALSDAARMWLTVGRGLRAVDRWEREHGAFTAEEMAAADEALDRAGVGRR